MFWVKKILLKGVAVIACASSLVATNSHADGFLIEGYLGSSDISASDYDSDQLSRFGVGYQANRFNYTLGYVNLGTFNGELQHDTHIDNKGAYVAASYMMPVHDVFAFEVGLGLAQITSEAYFNHRKIGEEDSTSLYVDAQALARINETFSLRVALDYFDTVSDASVTAVAIGARLNFSLGGE